VGNNTSSTFKIISLKYIQTVKCCGSHLAQYVAAGLPVTEVLSSG
jgi:hypothetical protein